MAVAHVQSKAAMQWSGTALTVTFDSNVAAGNLIAVLVGWASDSITAACSDGLSNSYTDVRNPTTVVVGTCRAAMFYAKNITGGACTITITFSGSAFATVVVHEISGADTSSPLDQSALAAPGYIGTDADAVTTGNVTTTTAGQYVFGAVYCVNGTAAATGTGFTDGTGTTGVESEYLIQVSAGNVAATFTNAVAQSVGPGIMTFKASGGGGVNTKIVSYYMARRRK